MAFMSIRALRADRSKLGPIWYRQCRSASEIGTVPCRRRRRRRRRSGDIVSNEIYKSCAWGNRDSPVKWNMQSKKPAIRGKGKRHFFPWDFLIDMSPSRLLGSSSHGIKGLERGKQGENMSELVNVCSFFLFWWLNALKLLFGENVPYKYPRAARILSNEQSQNSIIRRSALLVSLTSIFVTQPTITHKITGIVLWW